MQQEAHNGNMTDIDQNNIIIWLVYLPIYNRETWITKNESWPSHDSRKSLAFCLNLNNFLLRVANSLFGTMAILVLTLSWLIFGLQIHTQQAYDRIIANHLCNQKQRPHQSRMKTKNCGASGPTVEIHMTPKQQANFPKVSLIIIILMPH